MNDRVRAVALGNDPADLLLKNGRVVDVLTETIYEADVAIADGVIAGIGEYTEAEKVIDLKGAYIAPGLINSHCHVESSMAAPEVYCAEELGWGTTTLITDPHEIANVAGAAGIRYMLEAGRRMPINYYVQLPSCVPATPFEHAGCIMEAKDIAELMDLPGVLGLGEMMNVPGVLNNDPQVLEKIALFAEKGRVVDGHGPCLRGKALQAYAASGIETDHESMSWDEAKEKLRAGINLPVRQGSASRNLTAIIKGVLAEGIDVSGLSFCTDDKHLAAIHSEGTIRNCVKMAVELGMNPVRAIRIGSINAARIYGLKRLGAIAPGWQADIVVFNNLQDLQPLHVFHKGVDAIEAAAKVERTVPAPELRGSVRPADVSEKVFTMEIDPAEKYHVIDMLPGEIFTEHIVLTGAEVQQALADGTVHYIAVLERHHGTGNVGLGLIRGYGLKNGAVATTVAHDSHNLIVLGSNPRDMSLAAQELVRVQGGYTIVKNGVTVTLPLSICGLMSTSDSQTLNTDLDAIREAAHEHGVPEGIDPFISLSFMALPVIPKLRITDMGLFDAEHFCFIK